MRIIFILLSIAAFLSMFYFLFINTQYKNIGYIFMFVVVALNAGDYIYRKRQKDASR